MREFPESVNERIWETASCYPAHLWGERCPFTFVTSRQKTRCDVVRGQHPTPADDVGPAVTLPRKRWRHSGNPPAPLKNPDGTHVPSEKKAEGKSWFDSGISSHRSNCLCPTQILRLLHFLEAGLTEHRYTHPRYLFSRFSARKREDRNRIQKVRLESWTNRGKTLFFLRILSMERHHRFICELARSSIVEALSRKIDCSGVRIKF